jgi:hypothetical protein
MRSSIAIVAEPSQSRPRNQIHQILMYSFKQMGNAGQTSFFYLSTADWLNQFVGFVEHAIGTKLGARGLPCYLCSSSPGAGIPDGGRWG